MDALQHDAVEADTAQHWTENLRVDDPEAVRWLVRAARFWPKVQKTDTCWLWTGSVYMGYPRTGVGGRSGYAYREAWELIHGSLARYTRGLKRRCGTAACVRPAPGHWELGSQTARLKAHGRERPGRLLVLSEERIEFCRALYGRGRVTLEDLAQLCGVTRERIRQVIEEGADEAAS